jgi:hypothetical protein
VAVVVVTSSNPGEGKTGVAAAIARHYAYLGREVRLARLEGDGDSSSADAACFASFTFVPGSPAGPVAAASLSDPAGGILVVEAGIAEASSVAGAKVVLVSRNQAPASLPAGLTPTAIVVTDAPAFRGASTPTAGGAPPTVVLGEDRTLSGFAVSEARRALEADILVAGEAGDPTCDYLVVAPIASDAGQPYFRRFDTKAVVVRFDRTDMHLAAMQADPACLILTGGRRPSDYLFDAATAQGVTVLLSRTDTENTVIALERVFDHTRFTGERKLDRMAELLEGTALFDALAL